MKRIIKLTGIILMLSILAATLCSCGSDDENTSKQEMQALYGENQKITGDYDEALAAECNNGIFVGKDESGVKSYKGIPFAESPVGELRWKDPKLADDDNGVYEAYYYGKSPIQTEWVSEVGSYYKQGEDCLTLNVWTSDKTQTADKAVMVFFHGGSYGWGATSDPMYDGRNFVEAHDDIVLVTVEYRTGIMGFIDFSSVEGGEEYSTSGNLGLLDQICALEWLQKNIESFGGDKNNVTIFGESAGGGSVSLLPLIDAADGLFSRVIAESGSISLTYSKDECQRLTEMLLEETGAECMDDLLALSESELMAVNENLNDYNNFPERDGIVLPEDLYAAYSAGEMADVDMLIGTNADEARYWINEMGYYVDGISGELIYKLCIPIMYETNLKKISDEDMQYVNAFMDTQTDSKVWNITEFYNEILFRVPALYQAEAIADNGGNAYVYYWDYPCAYKDIGACHAVELAYVFNNLDETIYTGDNINTELAETVQEMWTNFAKTGNPGTSEYEWEKYTGEDKASMLLGENIHTEYNLLNEQSEAISPLLKYGFNGCYTNLSFNVPTVYKIAAVLVIILAVLITGIIMITKAVKKEKRQKKNAVKCQ